MNKWIRNLVVGSMMITIAFADFSTVSHANGNGDEVKHASEAFEKMDAQSQQQFMAGLTSTNLSNLDIETVMMMIQSERVRLLEEQLQSQIEDVQKRNQSIAELNEKLNVAKAELLELRKAENEPLDENALKKVQELEKRVEQLKNQMDSLSNSQQMDMLRLQSLSNKRNEAFELMTNFVKKMQENRSSIIGNMR